MIPLTIYKRWGWQGPNHNISEREELEKRRQFAVQQGANDEALQVLDKLCASYESHFYYMD